MSGNWTSSNNFDLSWNMTNWHLIRWLLDLDILVTHKFTLLDLKDKVTLNHVLNTFLTWAFNLWGELLSVDALIDLETTGITSVNSNLHARLDVAASSDNTFNRDEPSNRTGLDLSHFDEGLLG